MKKFILTIMAVTLSLACTADDRPVTIEQLPDAARSFIEANYPDVTISYAYVDDDLLRPDYTVRLSNGVEIEFEHSGALEKISSRTGIPEGIVPVQITEYVNTHYPDALIIEYEVGRKDYEVKLINGLELKFDSRFRLVEVDD